MKFTEYMYSYCIWYIVINSSNWNRNKSLFKSYYACIVIELRLELYMNQGAFHEDLNRDHKSIEEL